jgi:hypothetical protein
MIRENCSNTNADPEGQIHVDTATCVVCVRIKTEHCHLGRFEIVEICDPTY